MPDAPTLHVTADACKLARDQFEVEIVVDNYRRFDLRLRLAAFFLRCAAFCAPFEVAIIHDDRRPYLFNCPICKRESTGKTHRTPGQFVVICHYCRRQWLADDTDGELKIVRADDFQPCADFACDYVEPYGFVPEAGCPVHDRPRKGNDV